MLSRDAITTLLIKVAAYALTRSVRASCVPDGKEAACATRVKPIRNGAKNWKRAERPNSLGRSGAIKYFGLATVMEYPPNAVQFRSVD